MTFVSWFHDGLLGILDVFDFNMLNQLATNHDLDLGVRVLLKWKLFELGAHGFKVV